VKARILSAKTAAELEALVDKFGGEAITTKHVGYAIDPQGRHHALLLFTPGADRRDDVTPAASKFIADALESGTPGHKED